MFIMFLLSDTSIGHTEDANDSSGTVLHRAAVANRIEAVVRVLDEGQ